MRVSGRFGRTFCRLRRTFCRLRRMTCRRFGSARQGSQTLQVLVAHGLSPSSRPSFHPFDRVSAGLASLAKRRQNLRQSSCHGSGLGTFQHASRVRARVVVGFDGPGPPVWRVAHLPPTPHQKIQPSRPRRLGGLFPRGNMARTILPCPEPKTNSAPGCAAISAAWRPATPCHPSRPSRIGPACTATRSMPSWLATGSAPARSGCSIAPSRKSTPRRPRS